MKDANTYGKAGLKLFLNIVLLASLHTGINLKKKRGDNVIKQMTKEEETKMKYNILLLDYLKRFILVKDKKLIIDLTLMREDFGGDLWKDFLETIESIIFSDDPYEELYK